MRLSSDDTNNKQRGDTEFPYRAAIGMLMYLTTSTRPDLAFVVGQLSRFVAHPHDSSPTHTPSISERWRELYSMWQVHCAMASLTPDRITTWWATWWKKNTTHIVIEGYCDSDWANDPDQRKSTTGYVFTLAEDAVAWMSRRQSVIELSTAEAEYVAACEGSMEAMA